VGFLVAGGFLVVGCTDRLANGCSGAGVRVSFCRGSPVCVVTSPALVQAGHCLSGPHPVGAHAPCNGNGLLMSRALACSMACMLCCTPAQLWLMWCEWFWLSYGSLWFGWGGGHGGGAVGGMAGCGDLYHHPRQYGFLICLCGWGGVSPGAVLVGCQQLWHVLTSAGAPRLLPSTWLPCCCVCLANAPAHAQHGMHTLEYIVTC
jgi:hypothetical protein